eukprot:scaffold4026_cov117-Cylindrotheca_fusiformis.AAC.12
MEVLAKESASPFLLSNSEVLELLRPSVLDRKDKKLGKGIPSKKKYKHRDWIEDSVCEYLEKTPCASLDSSRREELRTALTSRKKAIGKNKKSKLTGFGLTEPEALQVLNFMPQEKVDIHLMVEELHSRMTDERQDELLELIQSYVVVERNEANDDPETDGDIEMEDGVEEPTITAIKEEI